MAIKFDSAYTLASAGWSATISAIAAGASSIIIGRNWLSVGVCGGFGFGLIQGTISRVASDNMPKNCPKSVKFLASELVGGATACGLSYAAASIGFIATPISIPTAVVLTVAAIAQKYFYTFEATMKKNFAYLANLSQVAANKKLVEEDNATKKARAILKGFSGLV
jgi:hypothetical protein